MSTSVADALAPLVSALEADGYGAVIDERPDVIAFQITAGPDACADCLSPRAIVAPMITNALQQAGYSQRLELTYPGPEH
jgi:hypothetical protein